jgi:hypothetical protein
MYENSEVNTRPSTVMGSGEMVVRMAVRAINPVESE